MKVSSIIKLIILAGAVALIGCGQSEQELKASLKKANKHIDSNKTAFSQACKGILSGSMEINANEREPIDIKLSCDNLDNQHPYLHVESAEIKAEEKKANGVKPDK